MRFLRKVKRALQMELREHKSSFVVYMIFRLIVIGVMFYQFYQKNWESGFLCVLTLVLLIMPSLVQMTLKIEFPTILEIIILSFIFAAQILGEIHEFYIIFPFWDTVLHTLNGFLMAAIGLSLVNILNQSDRMAFALSPLFTAIVAFCFSMTIGVIWEIFEFGMDQIFILDMQKDTIVNQISSVKLDPAGGNVPYVISDIDEVLIHGEALALGGYLDIGLIDTMHDLIVNFVGAIVFSIIGYFYVKNKNEMSIAQSLLPKRKEKDHDFWNQINQEQEAKRL